MLTFVALVNIDIAFGSDVATGTTTRVASVDHAGLADRPGVTRVGIASVVQVAQQPRFVGRTFANVAGHAIMTSTAIEARLDGAVVNVDLAVVAFESVNANARVASFGVVAGGPVLAHVWPRSAFIHVLGAETSRVFGRAVASVGADAIDTSSSILAKMSVAVVDVDVAS